MINQIDDEDEPISQHQHHLQLEQFFVVVLVWLFQPEKLLVELLVGQPETRQISKKLIKNQVEEEEEMRPVWLQRLPCIED